MGSKVQEMGSKVQDSSERVFCKKGQVLLNLYPMRCRIQNIINI